jgi:UDP-N-acetylglucosamine diphosphorylase/glucosamine-1-phosphate N-acetyltransferase
MEMNIVLFDDPEIRRALLPLTFTRPVSGLRVGIFTIKEKWELYLNKTIFSFTEPYLREKYPAPSGNENLYINGAIYPNKELVKEISALSNNETLVKNNLVIAYKGQLHSRQKSAEAHFFHLKNLWDIFADNGREIRNDFEFVKKNRKSYPMNDPHTRVYNNSQIFIEEGVKIRAAVLNAEDGPIYLGKNSEVQEGALIKGPFSLGESSHVNMGAKMRGDTTIGPFSKVGGEISNSVVLGYSNKAHEGFLGNSVIGEWCNLGADTNTSNLKNNYGEVEIYSYKNNATVKTGRQFCGLIMGDHSKCGINTMFNTGTVVGVSANIFGGGFPPKFIPSFSWGGSEELITFKLEKAFEVAQRAMARRNIKFDNTDKAIFTEIFSLEKGS